MLYIDSLRVIPALDSEAIDAADRFVDLGRFAAEGMRPAVERLEIAGGPERLMQVMPPPVWAARRPAEGPGPGLQ